MQFLAGLEQYGWWAALTAGFFLGVAHSFDADHLTVVSSIVTEQKTILRATTVGVFWGVGHLITLLTVGLAVIFFRATLAGNVENIFELCVGALLIAVGVRSFWVGCRLFPGRAGKPAAEAPHRHEPSFRLRPFLIGLVHGLAGSAQIMLLILSTIHSRTLGVVFIAVFGTGVITSMGTMSAVFNYNMKRIQERFCWASRVMMFSAGSLSVLMGGWWIVNVFLGR